MTFFGDRLQWLLSSYEYELNFPLNIEQLSEIQNHPNSIRSLTIPVYNLKNNLQNEKDGVDNKLDDNEELDELIDGISDQVKDDIDEEIDHLAAEILEKIDDDIDELADDIAEELDNNIDESTIAAIVQEVAEELGEETYEEIAEELTGKDLDEIEDDDADEDDEIYEIVDEIEDDLDEIAEEIAQEKNIIWKQKLESDLYLLGEQTLLRQLFSNLLQNALYYTPSGGLVEVQAIKANSKLIVIKVRDTGIGIAPEHLDQIFERFWRLDKSRSDQTGRSGLGLAIAREIVQLHRGTIVVESQLGVGSCFTVRFPVKASLNQ